jgi:hypothetical protein
MMPSAYKILGQSAPASTADVAMITVGASRSQVISTIVIANSTATAATCRIFARIAGAAASTANAILYDVSIAANTSTTITAGITLAATDVLTVRSGTANALTFTAFGSEIS